jgi:hypothetical protein
MASPRWCHDGSDLRAVRAGLVVCNGAARHLDSARGGSLLLSKPRKLIGAEAASSCGGEEAVPKAASLSSILSSMPQPSSGHFKWIDSVQLWNSAQAPQQDS